MACRRAQAACRKGDRQDGSSVDRTGGWRLVRCSDERLVKRRGRGARRASGKDSPAHDAYAGRANFGRNAGGDKRSRDRAIPEGPRCCSSWARPPCRTGGSALYPRSVFRPGAGGASRLVGAGAVMGRYEGHERVKFLNLGLARRRADWSDSERGSSVLGALCRPKHPPAWPWTPGSWPARHTSLLEYIEASRSIVTATAHPAQRIAFLAGCRLFLGGARAAWNTRQPHMILHRVT